MTGLTGLCAGLCAPTLYLDRSEFEIKRCAVGNFELAVTRLALYLTFNHVTLRSKQTGEQSEVKVDI